MTDVENRAVRGLDRAGPRRSLVAQIPLVPERAIHSFLALIYLVFYLQVYVNYLSIAWSYGGIFYSPLSAAQLIIIVVGIASVAWALPTRLAAPSSIILWLMFSFVYVPTMAQTFMLGRRPWQAYLPALLVFTVVMIALCLWCSAPRRDRPQVASIRPGVEMIGVLSGLAALMGGVLFITYRGILSFADITNSNDIYAARFAAADMTSGIVAYFRTYLPFAIGPGLIAAGAVLPRHRWMIFAGVASCVLCYMIDGSKISLIIPVAMGAIYSVMRWGRASTVLMTAGMAGLTAFCGTLTSYSGIARFFADLILLRSIAIPGQQFALYYDLFHARGYTWWSNIRGFSLVIPPPTSFASDPRWPNLGQIVGEEYYGIASQNNSNANMFAGEGIAAAGPLGLVVIALAFAIYLRVLDHVAAGWNRVFLVLAMVPIGLSLTNVHLSTTLLSYGGAFWVLALAFLRPRAFAKGGRSR